MVLLIDILVEAHPTHIGITPNYSGYSWKIMWKVWNKVTDIVVKNNGGVKGTTILANKLILATGHSARDIFELLTEKKYL
jgi:hypothetical protein